MNRSAPNIQAVFFDADGVLQSNTIGWIDRVRQLCGVAEGVDEFLMELFAAERPCILGNAEFEQKLSLVLKKWNSKSNASDAIALWKQIEPNDAVFALIRSTREQGTKVALATNQQRHRADYMLTQLGYSAEFNHILFSCDLGYAKPSNEYFRKSLGQVGLQASQVLFIDDSDANIQSARRVGLNAEQFHLADGVDALEKILNGYTLA